MDHAYATVRGRMLIVDDEEDICDCLAQFFLTRGYLVSTAGSGEEALNVLEKDVPDVVLLDVRLPGLSGIEVLKRVKDRWPAMRIVMVTALDQDDVRQKARLYGAVGYVVKPFDFSDTTWSAVL